MLINLRFESISRLSLILSYPRSIYEQKVSNLFIMILFENISYLFPLMNSAGVISGKRYQVQQPLETGEYGHTALLVYKVI